jgi:hypothetical protein
VHILEKNEAGYHAARPAQAPHGSLEPLFTTGEQRRK